MKPYEPKRKPQRQQVMTSQWSLFCPATGPRHEGWGCASCLATNPLLHMYDQEVVKRWSILIRLIHRLQRQFSHKMLQDFHITAEYIDSEVLNRISKVIRSSHSKKKRLVGYDTYPSEESVKILGGG
jgi:hypothetical protein